LRNLTIPIIVLRESCVAFAAVASILMTWKPAARGFSLNIQIITAGVPGILANDRQVLLKGGEADAYAAVSGETRRALQKAP
jgi:hypothetical protein